MTDRRDNLAVPVPHRLLWRACDCAAMLGISPRAWRRLVANECAPRPIRVTPTITRWRSGEIRAWIAAGLPRPSAFVWRANQSPAK